MKIKFFYSFLLLSVSFFVSKAQNLNNAEIERKINALIGKMTLEERVNMLHAASPFTSGGVPRLGIPEMVTSDGPHGVRVEFGRDWIPDENVLDSGTYLPTGVCLAATWNPQLGYKFGSVLGSEANFRGKDVILGPGINIIRSPLNGRNFEYQSEDPFLISKMAVGYIRGVQDQGVSACVKHFIANNQETKRASINVEMSERALREIYLPGFKAAVQLGDVNTVMGSYNKFRGEWATHNNYLMQQILKKEWNFKGLVMSDWNAAHSTSQAVWNGTDLEMGTNAKMQFFMGDTLARMVKNRQISEYLIDDKVRRILYVMYKTNMIEGQRKKGAYNTKEHQQIAKDVAAEGIVLLKNSNQILPIKASVKNVAIIGFNAVRQQSMGGGSSQVKAFYEISALQGLQNAAGTNMNFSYAKGYNIERGATADAQLINEAVQKAKQADMAIIVGGWTHGYDYSKWSDNAYDGEEIDKPDMMMPFGQDELIKAVVKANPNTVVVLVGGGPLDMSNWLGNVPAVVQAWYPGMEGGNALADILFGKTNPSGKLPMTFPKHLEDSPAHALGQYPGDGTNVYYNDDIYVGYRYFDTFKVKPEFAFGHGLSYTSFAYSNLKIKRKKDSALITFDLKNIGKKDGAEVAQVYVHEDMPAIPRPEKELKGFEKVFLKVGESKKVEIILSKDAFSYFDDRSNVWVTQNDTFQILVGSASDDIRLKSAFKR